MKSDDSNDETEIDQKSDPEEVKSIDIDNDNYDDERNDKIILLSIKKCYLLYRQYPNVRHIKKKVKYFENKLEKDI